MDRLGDAKRTLQVGTGERLPFLVDAELPVVEDDVLDIPHRLVRHHGEHPQGGIGKAAHAVAPVREIEQEDHINANGSGAPFLEHVVNERFFQDVLGNLNVRNFFHDLND